MQLVLRHAHADGLAPTIVFKGCPITLAAFQALPPRPVCCRVQATSSRAIPASFRLVAVSLTASSQGALYLVTGQPLQPLARSQSLGPNQDHGVPRGRSPLFPEAWQRGMMQPMRVCYLLRTLDQEASGRWNKAEALAHLHRLGWSRASAYRLISEGMGTFWREETIYRMVHGDSGGITPTTCSSHSRNAACQGARPCCPSSVPSGRRRAFSGRCSGPSVALWWIAPIATHRPAPGLSSTCGPAAIGWRATTSKPSNPLAPGASCWYSACYFSRIVLSQE